MKLFGWFKKNRVGGEMPKKFDFDKYKLRLTIKSICMFEKLTGKPFNKSLDENMIMVLMYCVFVCSNNLRFKLSSFYYLFEDERIATWFGEGFNDILNYISQFTKDEKEDDNYSDDKEPPFVSSLANSLIVQYGVDAHYVMDEMELWQLEPLYIAADDMIKNRYEEERLWTYLSVLPHIDGKKVNKPDKLLPFPWEKEEKKNKAEEGLKNNEYAIKHTIGRSIDDILHGAK